MFDLFGGVTNEHINESNQAHASNHLSLVLLLIEKGVVSVEELEKSRAKATHIVEQEWARKRKEAEKEFDEKHPAMREFMGKLFGADKSA